MDRPIGVGFTDPADDWDEDDGYEYDDTKPAALDEDTEGFDGLTRPHFVGIVSGAEYKLASCEDGVTEYALAVVDPGGAVLYEMSEADLLLLARQIIGLLSK